MKKLKLLAMGLCVSLFMNGQIYVDKDAIGGNDDGSSWQDAYIHIQDALTAATSGNEIWVAEGTYYADQKFPGQRNYFFHVKTGVSLYGGFSGVENNKNERNWSVYTTTLSGKPSQNLSAAQTLYSYRIFALSSNNDITIDGFTLADTYQSTSGYGNVLSANNSTGVLLTNCIIENHRMDNARGAFQSVVSSNFTVSNCLIKDNIGGNGSLALAESNGRIEFLNNTIINNTSAVNTNFVRTGGIIDFNNSILWNSGSSQYNSGGTITYDHSISNFAPLVNNNSNTDPLLNADGTPTTSSYAINNGNNTLNTVPFDLSHSSRVINSTIDIGAYEYFSNPNPFYRSDIYSSTDNQGCNDDDLQYIPRTTITTKTGGLFAGGEIDFTSATAFSCEKGLGKFDLKVVKADINGNVVFEKIYGSAGNDHLVDAVEFSNGNISLIGNTENEGNNSFFVLTIDGNNGSIISSVSHENAILKAGIYTNFYWMFTGEENGKMFYMNARINNSGSTIYHKITDPNPSRGNDIIFEENEAYGEVYIVGQENDRGAVWNFDYVVPGYGNITSMNKFEVDAADEIVAMVKLSHDLYLGSPNEYVFKIDLTNINSYDYIEYPTPSGVQSNVTDMMLDGNKLQVLFNDGANESSPTILTLDRTSLSELQRTRVGYTDAIASDLIYIGSESNKFVMDNFGNICLNTGYYINQLYTQNLTQVQRKSIYLHKLDKDLETSCNLILLDPYQRRFSGFAWWQTVNPIASGIEASTDQWLEESNLYLSPEKMCISNDVCATLSLNNPQVLNNGTSPTISSTFPCQNVPSFNGPSESLVLSTGISFVSYLWDFGGISYTTPTVDNPPCGFSNFSFYGIDNNGCHYYAEYCIRNVNSCPIEEIDPDFRKKSINSISLKEHLSIYPNPSSENFNLLFEAGQFSQITVRDITGRVIREINLTNIDSKLILNLSDKANGVYFVTATGNSNQQTIKIIKQ